MVMSSCPKCKQHMCDAPYYHRAKGEKRGGLKSKICCPSCDHIHTMQEGIDQLENE